MENQLGVLSSVIELHQVGESYLEVEDIYIPNNIRENLTADHVQKLQKMGWWEKMQMRYW